MISRSAFNEAALALGELQQERWTVVSHPQVYLTRDTHRLQQVECNKTSLGMTHTEDIDTLQITPQEELDVACSLHTPTHTLMTIRHHIIYSPIYKLPVLYVMAYHQEGTPLSLEEMYEAIIPEHYHHSLKIASTSSQGSLTQADHPFLNIPAYYLHPCDTANLLETVGISQSPTLVYLQSWLSLLGPVVGCDALEFIT